jgi:hypothetical protein
LSPVERDIVLLLVSVELNRNVASSFDRLSGRADGRPTVGALTAVLSPGVEVPDAVTRALAPGEHLLRSGLVEMSGDGPFPTRTVRLLETVWPRAIGLPAQLPLPVFPRGLTSLADLILAPATRAQAERALARAASDLARALLVVSGPPDRAPETVATALSCGLGLAGLSVTAALVDSIAAHPEIRREATWIQAAIIVQGVPAPSALARLAAGVSVPILVVADHQPTLDACGIPGRWRQDIEVAELSHELRVECWQRCLRGVALADGIDLATHAAQLRSGPGRIVAMAAAVRERARENGGVVTSDALRQASRRGAGRISGLAHRLEVDHDLRDLVIPVATRRELELACAWARHRASVFRSSAAGRRLHERDGLVCLFHGPPGTGKTLAAKAIAGELGVDLLRIDLSQVVDKYIGETEKNLDRVFVEADAGDAILFFDEADALFGKRSEVKDAHDRYANIEAAFLLQRLEVHRGVCILASNLRKNLDEAFTRRIQLITEFPLPGPDERTRIWELHLVSGQLDDDVDLALLGRRFEMAGGDIRNAAATALILAAEEHRAVAMRHLAIGVWREVKKSGRLTGPHDFAPWLREIQAFQRGGPSSQSDADVAQNR